jgi:hypothetical protein
MGSGVIIKVRDLIQAFWYECEVQDMRLTEEWARAINHLRQKSFEVHQQEINKFRKRYEH